MFEREFYLTTERSVGGRNVLENYITQPTIFMERMRANGEGLRANFAVVMIRFAELLE
jgi:hypothetical protein